MISSFGRVSLAPKVFSALTAMPSIAAAWKLGDDSRAVTASASTRPTESVTGTVSPGMAPIDPNR